MRSTVAAWALSASFLLGAGSAAANGRYPAARYLVLGPPPGVQTMALQTTFGVLMSTDGGRNWRWRCEESVGFTGTWDAPLAIGRDGTLAAGLPDGLSIAEPDYCGFERRSSLPVGTIVDLTADPRSDRMAAAYSPFDASPNGVLLSDDNGRTWRTGWMRSEFYIETLDIAPGAPQRMYASGFLRGGMPVLFRSNDGGMSFTEASRSFLGGYNAWIAAVDAMQPAVVYLRSDLAEGGAMLLRSDDAGATVRELARTRSAMVGAAFAPDGRTMWIAGASSRDGIQRSTDGGRTWRQVHNSFTPLCLRYQEGILFACASDQIDGFALACSIDGGESFVPILAFPDIQGPEECPAGSSVHEQCDPLWAPLQALLVGDGGTPRPPRGPHDGGVPLDARVPDSGPVDAGFDAREPMDAGNTEGPGGGACACSTPGHEASVRSRGAALLAPLAALLLRVRRRRAGTR
jgi:photosystem II stability/assembly factor-like uncharacterized protein